MAILHIKTLSSELKWQSDDGKIKKWEIYFNAEEKPGQRIKCETFSAAIANEGFSGEVETYDKTDKRGVFHIYLRQVAAPKTGGYSTPAPFRQPGTSAAASKQNDDDRNHTMYTSYAKDVAVAMIQGGTFNANTLDEILHEVAAGANILAGRVAPTSPVTKLFGETESLGPEDDPFAGMDVL